MARYVKIATIGAPPIAEAGGTGQEAVDRMIRYLQDQVAQVLPERPDLVVLPECCDRYPLHTREQRAAYYRRRGGQVREALAGIARDNRCYIVYPAIFTMPDGSQRNTACLLGRDGRVAGTYEKNHPVIDEITEDRILCGPAPALIECDFGRLGVAICFDLNFDVLRLKYRELRPDLIVFSSVYHGGLMQAYWAYSCRSYFVSAISGLTSSIISPVGHIIRSSTNYFKYAVATVNLDYRVVHLDFNWEKLIEMKRKYGPRADFLDPGFLGSVLVTSESAEFTAGDLVREFGLELLDDYLARSLAAHQDPRNIGAR